MNLMIHGSVPIGISLPREIIHRIDLDRKDIPRSRYMLRLIEKAYADENRIIMKEPTQTGSRLGTSSQSAVVDIGTALESDPKS